MAAKSKTRDQRSEARPLTRLERQSLIDALRYARCEPAAMRPLLNRAEAATLDMYRRIRHADKGAIPGVSRLAEYLGWTRRVTIEQLEALRRKGFIKRAADCSLYLESCEAVVFKCADALLTMAVSLASINPANEQQWRKYAALHHANAINICLEVAGCVGMKQIEVGKNTNEALYQGPIIPILRCIPNDRGQKHAAILREAPIEVRMRIAELLAEVEQLRRAA